ncbi:type II toxin-antitoxin system HicB family antitoxin [Paraburkholderia xenovorans]|uniref:HicB-like antitoxin of toxin-antitoxin system domain-containing protein n=1 Tax=Paraburkholderia xenovorans (strain LB400) TaxID=266265 RepID=Q13HJ0_PARXL|nr:type II toxin-antitoxin system HicB family antitoxin [Paraburkholderia xenovorans]ABE36449.1 hypothetical protein Bxe_C0550 [Paraburkholderia xenovorans LB400]
MDDGNGIWIFVDIDLTRVTSKSVGIQANLLESLLQQVDARAKERRMTRYAFVTLALIDELKQHDNHRLAIQFMNVVAGASLLVAPGVERAIPRHHRGLS